MSETKPFIIFVEGNIATGKSTFLSLIAKHLKNVQVIHEPVDKWTQLKDSNNINILDYFYKDMDKYTYSFQSFAFLSRVMLLDEIDKSKNIVFIERSIFSDREIFAKNCLKNGTMKEIEWNLYTKWFDWMLDKLYLSEGKNYLHLYLKCPADECYRRLKERNRNEEQNVSQEYLQEIHDRHEEWLKNKNCVVVDASKNFRDDFKCLQKIVSHIDKQLHKEMLDHDPLLPPTQLV
jgi:deoxyguanosine kinase